MSSFSPAFFFIGFRFLFPFSFHENFMRDRTTPFWRQSNTGPNALSKYNAMSREGKRGDIVDLSCKIWSFEKCERNLRYFFLLYSRRAIRITGIFHFYFLHVHSSNGTPVFMLCYVIFRVNMKTIVAISLTFVGIYRSSTKKKIKISLYSIQLQNNTATGILELIVCSSCKVYNPKPLLAAK